MPRSLVRTVHRVAGILGFLTILAFWSATVLTEAFGGPAAIVAVKQAILYGMAVLAPALAAAGATGFTLGGRSVSPVVAAKRRRMPVIALNGLLVLVPSAFYLAASAAAGRFDTAFVVVQAIEMAAGALNLVLMGLNIRDGLKLRPRRPRSRRDAAAARAG